MYEEYGLGQPTAWSVRTREELLYGTAQERRGRIPVQRPLSADIAAHAAPAAHFMEEVPPADQAPGAEVMAPVGAAQGIGELVAAQAEMTLGGQEG